MNTEAMLPVLVGIITGFGMGSFMGCMVLHIHLEHRHKRDMAELQSLNKGVRRE